jgi:hypothetical protein
MFVRPSFSRYDGRALVRSNTVFYFPERSSRSPSAVAPLGGGLVRERGLPHGHGGGIRADGLGLPEISRSYFESSNKRLHAGAIVSKGPKDRPARSPARSFRSTRACRAPDLAVRRRARRRQPRHRSPQVRPLLLREDSIASCRAPILRAAPLRPCIAENGPATIDLRNDGPATFARILDDAGEILQLRILRQRRGHSVIVRRSSPSL